MTRLILETLSPVHIGNGEKYSSAEFISAGSSIHRMDINEIYTILSEKEKELFVTSLENERFRLDDFIRGKKIPYDQMKLYSVENKGNTPFEIKEHIKTGLKGYVPGSSVKGAIKTAVLSAFVGENEIDTIYDIFEIREPKRRNHEIQHFIEDIFSSGDKKSSYSDFMRFVEISDFMPINKLAVFEVRSLEVGEKKGWYWYKRNYTVVKTFCESIKAGEKMEGDIRFTYHENMHHGLGLKGKSEILNLEDIKGFVHTFSSNLINYELSFSKKYGIDFLTEFYENLKKLNTLDSPLIKIGHGSGFLGTTIGIDIKKDPEVFEKVRKSLRGRSYGFEYPKTRLIAFEENVPMGWCKIL